MRKSISTAQEYQAIVEIHAIPAFNTTKINNLFTNSAFLIVAHLFIYYTFCVKISLKHLFKERRVQETAIIV